MTDFINKVIAIPAAYGMCWAAWKIYEYLRDYLFLSPFEFMKWPDKMFVIFVGYLIFSFVWATIKMLIVVYSGKPRVFS